MGEEAVLADSGRVGEIVAGAGRVRRLAFLSILQGGSPVIADMQTNEIPAYPQSFFRSLLTDSLPARHN